MPSQSQSQINRAKILECTIRDGSYATAFEESETTFIVQALEQVGFDLIEVGHGLGLGCYKTNPVAFPLSDEVALAAASKGRSRAQLGVFFIPGLGTDDDLRLARDLGIDFVRIGQTPRNWKRACHSIEFANDLGFEVYFNFMKSYIVGPLELALHAKSVANLELAGLYLVDSAGGMTPNEVGTYVSLLAENVTCPIGFHGHNNLGLAHANNLLALENGASIVDTTLAGLGRGGGNAATETMTLILQKIGLERHLDVEALLDLKEDFVKNRSDQLLPTGIDLVSGFAMFHSGFLEMFIEVADEWNVDVRQLIVQVSRIDQENPRRKLVEQIAQQLTFDQPKGFVERT